MKIKLSQIEKYLINKAVSTLDKNINLDAVIINKISKNKELMLRENMAQQYLSLSYKRTIKDITSHNIIIIFDDPTIVPQNRTSMEIVIPKPIKEDLCLSVENMFIYDTRYDVVNIPCISKNTNFYKVRILDNRLLPLFPYIQDQNQLQASPKFSIPSQSKKQVIDIVFDEGTDQIKFNFIKITELNSTNSRIKFGKQISDLFNTSNNLIHVREAMDGGPFALTIYITDLITIEYFQEIFCKSEAIKNRIEEVITDNPKIRYHFHSKNKGE